ncbi:MAG: DUF1801 domain-containing protein [Thermoanaerobaculia bacterium]|nr:DUF1801 domain-containing protein [Thermoanaerobaculia bacterium]
MAELKTKVNDASVTKFLEGIADERKRRDCFTLVELMRKITKEEPKMWGTSMVGFGTYHYKYASGREGDWFATGFAPRKQDLTIYLLTGFVAPAELMAKLGKHKTGVSCLYVKTLDDVHMPTLKKLITDSVKSMKTK